jgi:hypothetical protein
MRKIIQVGNSAGVLIPRGVLEELGWSVGTPVVVRARRRALEVAPFGDRVRGAIGAGVVRWVEEFILRYGPALRGLAD